MERCWRCGSLSGNCSNGLCEDCLYPQDMDADTSHTLGPAADVINQPPHYTYGSVEVIDAIEGWELNYRLGNVVKYVARHARKGKPLQDLKKALWYLSREIKAMEEGDNGE